MLCKLHINQKLTNNLATAPNRFQLYAIHQDIDAIINYADEVKCWINYAGLVKCRINYAESLEIRINYAESNVKV